MVTSTELSKVVADAFGYTPESVHLHLRTIRENKKISFKGYGRGAAAMTSLDAARLVIAVAGSTFAKDSMTSLNRFSGLLSDKDRRTPQRSRRRLEDFLAERIVRTSTDLHYVQNAFYLEREDQRRSSYRYPPRYNLAANVALKLMWIDGEESDSLPRVAVVRWFRADGGGDAMSFSPEGQTAVIDEAHFAFQFEPVGIIKSSSVTARSLTKIALSLGTATDQ